MGKHGAVSIARTSCGPQGVGAAHTLAELVTNNNAQSETNRKSDALPFPVASTRHFSVLQRACWWDPPTMAMMLPSHFQGQFFLSLTVQCCVSDGPSWIESKHCTAVLGTTALASDLFFDRHHRLPAWKPETVLGQVQTPTTTRNNPHLKMEGASASGPSTRRVGHFRFCVAAWGSGKKRAEQQNGTAQM